LARGTIVAPIAICLALYVKVFRTPETIDYSDSGVRFRGRLLTATLYDISNSEQITKKAIVPMLGLFREAG
jgi:hypothetical protein